jgi:hypothetical protein
MLFIEPTKYIKKITGHSWTHFNRWNRRKLGSGNENLLEGHFMYFRRPGNNMLGKVELGDDWASTVRSDDSRAERNWHMRFLATEKVIVIGIGYNYKDALEQGVREEHKFAKFKYVTPTQENIERGRRW